LGRVNADPDQIRAHVEQMIVQSAEPTSDAIALTPRTQRVIVAAIAQADQMGGSRVGTQHLLLGLLQEGQGAAFEVLTESGVGVENASVQLPERALKVIADILSALRTAIADGTYQPGERLIESALAEQLGSSRGPVRAALEVLAREGLVVMRPWRGAFVASSSPKDIE
jgi:DNA-binding GntR family transcriptional regulator